MTLLAPFLLPADGYSPGQFQDLVDSAFPPGDLLYADITGLLVSAIQPEGQDAPLSVNVSPGMDTIIGSDGQSRYLCSNTAQFNVQLDAAPGHGLARIDAIYDQVVNSGAQWIIDTVTGDPASSPVSPSCPAFSNPIAYVLVGSDVPYIDNEHITRALSAGEWWIRGMNAAA
jgi:hypothetical protein